MDSKNVHLGEPTLQKMNAEIEANKAAIAELRNPTPPVVPDMTMSQKELVALAEGIDTEEMTKAEIIEAINSKTDPAED